MRLDWSNVKFARIVSRKPFAWKGSILHSVNVFGNSEPWNLSLSHLYRCRRVNCASLQICQSVAQRKRIDCVCWHFQLFFSVLTYLPRSLKSLSFTYSLIPRVFNGFFFLLPLKVGWKANMFVIVAVFDVATSTWMNINHTDSPFQLNKWIGDQWSILAP